jgi:hypothetical protein
LLSHNKQRILCNLTAYLACGTETQPTRSCIIWNPARKDFSPASSGDEPILTLLCPAADVCTARLFERLICI